MSLTFRIYYYSFLELQLEFPTNLVRAKLQHCAFVYSCFAGNEVGSLSHASVLDEG